MERKQPLNWKRLTLEIIVLLTITIAGGWAISTQIHMTAPAAQGQAAFYMDPTATQQITNPWDWAQHGITGLNDGDTITVYIKNTGSNTINVDILVLNPTCVIDPSPQSIQAFPPGGIQAVTLTFSQIVGGSTISWDLSADY